MIGEWWSYAALLLFVVVVISPAWAFSKVDRALDGADISTESILTHPASQILVVGTDEQLTREAHVLQTLTKMIECAPNDVMRRIWSKKREEYFKELRWKKLVEVCDGRSRVYN